MKIELISNDRRAVYYKLLKTAGIADTEVVDESIVAGVMLGDQPVGIVIAGMEEENMYLNRVWVLPEHRCQKIGTALVERLVSECILRDVEAIHFIQSQLLPKDAYEIDDIYLENEGIKKFFEKNDFFVAEEIVSEGESDTVIMSGSRVLF